MVKNYFKGIILSHTEDLLASTVATLGSQFLFHGDIETACPELVSGWQPVLSGAEESHTCTVGKQATRQRGNR